MYYSQFDEDRQIAEIFPLGEPHLCVEVGANDGIRGSTTMFFEQHGWRCVLVEPNPDLCAELRRTRPDALLFECGAGAAAGSATLYIAEGADRADGVSTMADERTALDHIAGFGFAARPVEVAVRTLDDILASAARPEPLAFVSIDVEGLEEEVLRGFDLQRWRPRIVLVEDNSNGQDRTIRDHLAQRDYVPFHRTGVNDWYAHRDDDLAADGARRHRARSRAIRRADARAHYRREARKLFDRAMATWPLSIVTGKGKAR